MFRFTLISVGKMKNRSLSALCEDYTKRLKRQGTFELVELKDGDVASEGRRILDVLDKRPGARVYALGEEGQTFSSAGLERALFNQLGQPVVFIVGGAYGLSDAVKGRSDGLLALSPMTFTHEIARMLLMEQLYRAVSIHLGSKYHHE